MNYHSSWTAGATEAFEKCVVAHGGWTTWNSLTPLQLKVTQFRGLLPFLKGFPQTFQLPEDMVVDPKQRLVQFRYPTHVDVFQDGHLTFSPNKQVVTNGRQIFKRSILEKWLPQHSLYFFGYAWANYIGYPFILPEFELLAHSSSSNCFTIKFPENFHTHSQIQKFYFNSDFLLYRHDYHAEVAGSLVYAAHYTEGYGLQNGIQVAYIRKVRPRLGPLVLPIYGIYAELKESKTH